MKRLGLLGMTALLMAMPAPGRGADVATDIVQLSPDTYVIRRKERSIFTSGPVSKQRARIFEDAMTFAAQQGKLAEQVTFEETEHPLNEYYGYFTWEYQFRLVDDPDRKAAPAQRAVSTQPAGAGEPAAPAGPAAPVQPAVAAQSAIPAAAVVESSQSEPAPPQVTEQVQDVDELYDQLTKLDDLRKKGILTDEEFETLKQRVLNAN